MRCKRNRRMMVKRVYRNRNGAPMARGGCMTCGSNMSTFLPRNGSGLFSNLSGLVGKII